MTTAPDTRMPLHVGGHTVTRPRGSQTWCEANPGLFTTLLDEAPAKGDTEGVRNYRDGIDVARDMCSRMCPRFEECLKAAIEGPPVAGFVAGLTETERQRHREHLSITEKAEPVNDRAVGLTEFTTIKSALPDHDEVDAFIRRMPEASAATIAQFVDASASTIKRRKRVLAREQAATSSDVAAGEPSTAPTLGDHVDTYYLIREAG